jgi:hypothetical protein
MVSKFKKQRIQEFLPQEHKLSYSLAYTPSAPSKTPQASGLDGHIDIFITSQLENGLLSNFKNYHL